MTESDKIFNEAEDIMKCNSKTIDRILRNITDTNEILVGISSELSNQHEQAKNIHQDLISIEYVTKKSNRKLDSINSIWGTIANKIKFKNTASQPSSKTQKQLADNNKKRDKKREKNKKKREKNKKKDNQVKVNSKIENFASVSENAPISAEVSYNNLVLQNEKKLSQVICEMDKAKNQALNIGNKTKVHIELLEKIDTEGGNINDRMKNINYKMRKLV